ncbi:hypothetical protein BC832DRAFT_543001 [Gaertneriomyces semiglobifer]|nr:hypothetical protein BC832DRAFT_543001 [Gaertneriomyces semiglobifer]
MHMDFGDVPNLRFDFTLCPHTGKVIKEELTDALQQLPQQKQEEYSQAQAFLADLENDRPTSNAGANWSTSKTDIGHEQLYRAATFCHGVHKYLLQCISLFANRLPPDYNQLEAPSREQIPNDLFRVFGHQLSYISCIMDEFIPLIRNHTADLERAGVTFTDFVKQMGKRLTLVVRAMDDIFQVVS